MALELPQITSFLSQIFIFNGLGEENLAAIAQKLEEQHKPAEEIIYEEGQESVFLYFLYEGRVQMTRYQRGATEEEMLGFLDQGDVLGLEVLEAREMRRATVQTTTPVTLLCLNAAQLVEIADQMPVVLQRLNLLVDSFHLMLNTRLDWVNPEEYIEYIARKHPVFMWLRLVPVILLTVVLSGVLIGLYGNVGLAIFLLLLGGIVLVASGITLWVYIDWANDYYIVTSRRVVFQERIVLLYDSRQESPMEQVQSTEIDRPFIGQLLGFGDVRIRTYTGLILFKAVKLPGEVEAIIQQQLKHMQSSLRQAELRAIEETIARKINLVRTPPPPPAAAPSQTPPASMMHRFLADLFHLRYEFGDTIQYRTHWWILISRIWLQSVLLLGLTIASVYFLVQVALGRVGGEFPIVGAFLGLMLAGLMIFLWWLYVYLDWHNDRYLITSEQVIDINRKPLGKEERRAAAIRNILSVEYKRLGIIGLLLNFGTVYIRIGDTLFTFDNVFNPSEVQRELFHRIALRSLRERQQQAEGERQRMAEWISTYHRLTRQ